MRRWTRAPLEQDVQTAAQQTAGRAFHAGRDQTAERAHGQVVLICTRKGVNNTADQQRHERDTRSAQAHGTLGTRKQQHGDADQRKRHDIRALADERTDARCSHLSSTPSIGRIDSRHSRPTMPQIAPQTGRDRIGPSSSGCGCAARLPLGALFVDFLVVVFLAAKTSILQLLCDSI